MFISDVQLFQFMSIKGHCFLFLQPVLIGKAIYLLNYLLQNKQLSQTVFLPVQNMEGDGEFCKVGPLKVI